MDYARSKLCNLLMTAELSRRLTARHSSVTASCVSPGRVNTHIFANVPGLLRPPLQLLAGLLFQTPQQVGGGGRQATPACACSGPAGAELPLWRQEPGTCFAGC